MIIKNANVFFDNRRFEVRDLFINNGIIVNNENEAEYNEVVDAKGCFVIPGLIDIHSHGAVGCDFSDADVCGLKKILNYEKTHGITSYCPTSMTLPEHELINIFSAGFKALKYTDGAEIAGFNMEGPFIDREKIGAQNPKYIVKPSVSLFEKCRSASGNMIKLVTVSPKEDGAFEFIEQVKNEVVVSLGHTSSDYDTAIKAIKLGVCHITHLFNAMPPFMHRAPGVIGAAFVGECMVELICDGIHLHDSVIKAAFKLFEDRVILISDSMMATGMPDGEYKLGGQRVFVRNNRAELKDGSLAGSASNLFDCLKYAVSIGIPKEKAVCAATANPAKSIGIYEKVGSISPGKKAHLLILDKSFNLVRVIK